MQDKRSLIYSTRGTTGVNPWGSIDKVRFILHMPPSNNSCYNTHMFTGIISHMGIIEKKEPGQLLFKASEDIVNRMTLGMSVAVNGACLTVTSLPSPEQFTINFMPETARKTTIQHAKDGDIVNLELPVTAETLFAGHIVQGHVDTVGKITALTEEGNSWIITIAVPQEIATYMVDKGSVAVNGISLTIIQAHVDSFTVGIIPHTWENTMLHTAKSGTHVNIEVDVLAKYVEKMVRSYSLPNES